MDYNVTRMIIYILISSILVLFFALISEKIRNEKSNKYFRRKINENNKKYVLIEGYDPRCQEEEKLNNTDVTGL